MGRYRKVTVNGVVKPEHIVVWENVHGPLPKGMVIHHINGNGRDNRIENLVAMTVSEHLAHHHALRRQGKDPVDASDPSVIHDREQQRKTHAKYRQVNSGRIKKYYQEHREEAIARVRAYEKANWEATLAMHKAYREAHKEEARTYQKAYRQAHLAEKKANDKAYRESHREEIAEYKRVWCKQHRSELNARSNLNYAIRHNRPPEVIFELRKKMELAKKEDTIRNAQNTEKSV